MSNGMASGVPPDGALAGAAGVACCAMAAWPTQNMTARLETTAMVLRIVLLPVASVSLLRTDPGGLLQSMRTFSICERATVIVGYAADPTLRHRPGPEPGPTTTGRCGRKVDELRDRDSSQAAGSLPRQPLQQIIDDADQQIEL